MTEKMANNILNENFSDIITYHKFSFNLTNNLKDKNAVIFSGSIETSKLNYIDGVIVADVLDALFKDEIENIYFNDKEKFKDFYPKHKELEPLIKEMKNVCADYIDTAKNYTFADRKFSLPKLNNLNDSIIQLIKKYDEINPLSNEDFFKVTDIFVKHNISDERYNFPLSQIAIATLDIHKFGKHLESLDENEVIDILSGRADKFEYRRYYKVLEKANTEREKYTDNIKDKDLVEIVLPKDKEEFGKSWAKLEKEDTELFL